MPLPRLRHHPSPISGTSGVSRCCQSDKLRAFSPAVLICSSFFSSSSQPADKHHTARLKALPSSPATSSSTLIPNLSQTQKQKHFPPLLHSYSLSALSHTSYPFPRATPKLPHHRYLSTSPTPKMTYKLKDLPSLADIPPKHEVEVEGIEDAKVLLVKSGNKTHAISPRCTHYGAPLKGGVVDGDRLTCPWHGGMLTLLTEYPHSVPLPFTSSDLRCKYSRVSCTP